MLDNGTRVNVVVPFGPNYGEITRSGIIVKSVNSGIDGLVYFVKEANGEISKHSESWIRRQ